jgi:periplasmic protein TonB
MGLPIKLFLNIYTENIFNFDDSNPIMEYKPSFRFLVFVVFTLTKTLVLGQDTIFFDSTSKKISSHKDAYYYKVTKYNPSDTDKGTVKEFNRSGKIIMWFNYISYSKHLYSGKEFEWYDNGQKKSDIDIVNGIWHGWIKTWWENGQLRREDSLAIGKFIKGKCYATDGTDTAHYDFDIQPGFSGGEEARLLFLQNNIVYPVISKENGSSGIVYVTFVIEPDGSITNIGILKGVDEFIDQECIRVVKMMPKWIPGIREGKKVRVKIKMPISFKVVE